MTTKIIGTGSYLPEYVVTNDDLAKLVDTSDEWIASSMISFAWMRPALSSVI